MVGKYISIYVFPNGECKQSFLVEGDISSTCRRTLRKLHTLPHRDGYRR